MLKRILPVFIIAFVLTSFFPVKTLSQVTTCEASVSPGSIQPNSIYNLSFNISNADSDVAWVKITRPTSDFVLQTSLDNDWEVSGTVDYFIYSNGYLTAGDNHIFEITVLSGANQISSQDWSVEISGFSQGDNAVSCSGALGVSISGGADSSGSTYPLISSISVKETTTSSALIGWTTDKPANSFVEYGTTSNYHASLNEAVLTTTHAVLLANLKPATLYHYRVKSTDQSGQTTLSSDKTFSTPKVSINVSNPEILPPSQGAINDQIPPSVEVTFDFTKPFKTAPIIAGRASDNIALTRVDYSTDDGENWLPVDDLELTNPKQASFSFQPFVTADGDYPVRLRAVDQVGLVTISEAYLLVIDRLEPRVGAAMFSRGPFVFSPQLDGQVVIPETLETKVTLSAVGGATTVDLIYGGKLFPLTKNVDSGLWSGSIKFDAKGVYQISARAIDGAKNLTTRRVSKVNVHESGRFKDTEGEFLSEGKLEIYALDQVTNDFHLWKGATFEQENPQAVASDGRYRLLLPSGKYYLVASAPGYKSQKTNIFTVEKVLAVNHNFALEKAFSLGIGPLKLTLPSQQKEVKLNVKAVENSPGEEFGFTRLLGKTLPTLRLLGSNGTALNSSLFGKPTIISVVNSWSPLTSTQLTILEKINRPVLNLVTVFSQESPASVAIYQKRGSYNLEMLADPNGEIAANLSLYSAPTHYFLSRKAVVEKVVVGVLSEEELLKNLNN